MGFDFPFPISEADFLDYRCDMLHLLIAWTGMKPVCCFAIPDRRSLVAELEEGLNSSWLGRTTTPL